MKAVKIDVKNDECANVPGLVDYLNDDDTFAYQLSRTSFIIVTEGECGMSRALAVTVSRLGDETEYVELRR